MNVRNAIVPFLIAAAVGGCRSSQNLESSVPPTHVPRTAPEKTVRFPGGNYGAVSFRDGIAVTSSGWSREDTAAVFDVTDPNRPRFLARFPAKGYSCAEPVFFGDRCYVPNNFCATVIDLADRKNPKLAGYLNAQFPKDGCRRLWVEDGSLFFEAFDGCHRVNGDGLTSDPTDRIAPKRDRKAPAAGTAEIRNSSVVVGAADIPFAYCLSTLAVKDGTAYVYSPGPSGSAQLLMLPPKANGLTLFGSCLPATVLPRGDSFQTMGMQTAGCVTRVGDILFVDDGMLRLTRSGKPERLLNRTRAVANASVDGTRIALAQCSRCRVLDFTDIRNVRIVDVAPRSELPLHVTGCHLRGDELFVAYTLVERKGQDFIYSFPSKGYVASFDLRRPADPLSTVEVPACVAIDRVGDFLYVSCRKGDFVVVDASAPRALKVRSVRRDILDGDGYKVKTFENRTFVLNGHRVVELDTSAGGEPQVKRLYDRGDGTDAPSYDDFTVDGRRLYALAHASMDVFVLDDATRTTEARNDCGENGVLKAPLAPADAAVFTDHAPNRRPPEGVEFRAGRFGNSFGAFVCDWVRLPDGRYAVAYGEAGLVFCDAKGGFSSELPRGTDGWIALFATEVVFRNGVLYAKDADGGAYEIRWHGKENE